MCIRDSGVPVNDLDEDEWHMLVHSYYASIAEIVMHNYPKPAALKYAHTPVSYTHLDVYKRQGKSGVGGCGCSNIT